MKLAKRTFTDRFIKLTRYSPSQANLTLKMFGSIWRFAQVHCSTDDNPILKHNPIDVIPAKRGWNKTKSRTRHLDEGNIHVFYNAVLNYFTERSLYDDASKNAVRDLVLFIMYTGCRRNEAQTLKWENVDIEKDYLYLKIRKMVMIICYLRWVTIYLKSLSSVMSLQEMNMSFRAPT